MEINNLVDLNFHRTAPRLSNSQVKKMLEQLEANIFNADWITIGIMAPCDTKAIKALHSITQKYYSIKFENLETSSIKFLGFLVIKWVCISCFFQYSLINSYLEKLISWEFLTNVSSTIVGTQFTLRATTVNTLFGSNSTLVSTLTFNGLDSGARITIPITITKSTT